MVTVDSLCLLLAICAQASRTKDGRKTKSDLMRETGFSAAVLSTGYAYGRGPETVRQIGLAFAKLYGLEPAPLLRLIDGVEQANLLRLIDEEKDKEQRAVLKARLRTMQKEDDALRAVLEEELRKMRCTQKGPHLPSHSGLPDGWYDQLADAELIIPAIRCCKACALRAKSRIGDGWATKLKRNAGKLPAAINQAVAALGTSGRTLTYEGLAEKSGMPLREVRKTLAQAGLEKERKGRKNFSRYMVWIGITIWSLIGAKGEAATVGETADRQIPEYILSALFAAILEQVRRWAAADRLRRWFADLAGTAPALGPVGGAA